MSLKFFFNIQVCYTCYGHFSLGPINSEFINIRLTLFRVNFLHSNLHYTRGTGITSTLSGGPVKGGV